MGVFSYLRGACASLGASLVDYGGVRRNLHIHIRRGGDVHVESDLDTCVTDNGQYSAAFDISTVSILT